MPPDERSRGILSPADRAYLRGESELASAQSERNTRARIRTRIRDSLLDFELLVEHLSDRDRELIFENGDGIETFDALASAVAFLYEGVDGTDLSFETALTEGINVAEAKRDRAASVDLEVTLRALAVEQLRRELENGETLSLTEVAYLYASEEVREDELARYFRNAKESPSEIDDGRIQSRVTDF